MQIGIGIAIGIAVGAALALLAVSVFGTTGVSKARRIRDQLLEDARRESEAVRREGQVEAREQAMRLRTEIDTELTDRRAQVMKIEERVLAKEIEIEQKLGELSRRDQGLADREEHIRQLQDELKETKHAQLVELEQVAGLTQADARALLLERGEEQARHELARRVRTLEDEARAESKRRARNLVADALQRVAASHTAETTVTVVELPSDDMKGRIIGREGRNIRALEHLTGVDFIVDDTPARGRPLLVRRSAPRSRAADGHEASGGRPDPPGADRGDVLRVEGGGRGGRPPGRRAGGLRGELRAVRRRARPDPRPAAVPDELRPERPQAHARGRSPRRDHGHRARGERPDGEARGDAARHRQGDDARGRGLARAHLRPARAALRRDPRASSTPSRRTTTRSSRRRSRPSS